MIQKPVILVIAHDAGVRQALERVLSDENFGVVCAANGTEALRRFWEHSIDVALLDQELGRECGWEALKQLRKVRPGLPAIIMTTRCESNGAPAEQNGETLMTMPLDLPLLFQTLDALCATTGATRLTTATRDERLGTLANV